MFQNKLDIEKKKLFNLFRSHKGFTLVELMVALTILLLIVFAFTPLLLGSIERIHYAGDKSEALYQSQAEIEVKIFERDTIDGHEVTFVFGDNEEVSVTVPGGFIEIEQSKGDAIAWLSTFMPYVPSIRLSSPFLNEGYDGDGVSTELSIVLRGTDTRLSDADNVDIYTREQFEQEGYPEYTRNLTIISDDGQPSGYDEYAEFKIPAEDNGLTNANSPYYVVSDWTVNELLVTVTARLHILMPYAVAVGNNGSIIVAPDPDEDTWNIRNNEQSISGNINDVLWASFRFVAITSNGTALIWGNQEEPQEIAISGINGVSLNSMVSGNGKLVAVGDNGTIAVSADGGKTWALRNSGTTEDLHAVSWNGSEFVAVGTGGIFTRAPDPNNLDQWEAGAYSEPGRIIELNGLAYGDGRWIIVGSSRPSDESEARRAKVYSWDGNEDNDWLSHHTSGPGNWLNDITYAVMETGPKFVAVGKDGRVMIMTSYVDDDGNFALDVDPKTVSSAELHTVHWDDYWNKEFIVVGSGGTVIKGDSAGWNVLDSAGSQVLKGVTVKWEN